MHFSKRYGDECERARNNSDSHLRCRVSLSICLGYQLITWPPGRPRLDSGPPQNPDQDHLKLSSEPEWTHRWHNVVRITICITDGISWWWHLERRPDGPGSYWSHSLTLQLSTDDWACAVCPPQPWRLPGAGARALTWDFLIFTHHRLRSARPVQHPAKLWCL